MCSINNFNSLFNAINNDYNYYKNVFNLTKYINNYNGDDWIKYIDYNTADYTIIKLLDYCNYDLEMAIICWCPNQVSEFRDHANNSCITKILTGEIIENLYDYDYTLQNTTCVNENKVSFIEKHYGLHQLRAKTHAVSLHVYTTGKYHPFL
jgi:hypothetical protein